MWYNDYEYYIDYCCLSKKFLYTLDGHELILLECANFNIFWFIKDDLAEQNIYVENDEEISF